MAVWQFKFYLVPIKGIVEVHGKVVPTLSEYALTTAQTRRSAVLKHKRHTRRIASAP